MSAGGGMSTESCDRTYDDSTQDEDRMEGSSLSPPSDSATTLKVQFNFKMPAKSGSTQAVAVPRLPCNVCSFVTDSEMSLSAHKRSHRLFECAHCGFKHTLAARIQSHCLSQVCPIKNKTRNIKIARGILSKKN